MDSSQETSLRVRIDQIDYALAPTGSLDRAASSRVPVIRIYGPSSTGKKACVHIHQVYPYFYVDYSEALDPPHVNKYIAKLTHSLNHAIAVSLKRNPSSRKSRFVRAIVLVKGVPFYGFHASYSPFLKIFVNDPIYISRAVVIMQSGSVMRTQFKTFENHLSYPLQFMCDYDLYGCGWIDLGKVWERSSENTFSEEMPDGSLEAQFEASPYFRQTRMELEVDVVAHQILNRHQLGPRNIHHELIIPAPALPKDPLIRSVRELWDDERQRRVQRGLSPSPEMPVDPSERSRGSGGHWVAEARWWEGIIRKIEKERGQAVQDSPKRSSWEQWVMTTFESIEVLWEDEWKTWRPAGLKKDTQERNPFSSPDDLANPVSEVEMEGLEIDIDEGMLSSQELTQLVNDRAREATKTGQDSEISQEHDIAAILAAEYADTEAEDGPPLENEEQPVKLNDSVVLSEIAPDELRLSQGSHDRTPKRNGVDPLKESPRKRKNPFGVAWAHATGKEEPSFSPLHSSTKVKSHLSNLILAPQNPVRKVMKSEIRLPNPLSPILTLPAASCSPPPSPSIHRKQTAKLHRDNLAEELETETNSSEDKQASQTDPASSFSSSVPSQLEHHPDSSRKRVRLDTPDDNTSVSGNMSPNIKPSTLSFPDSLYVPARGCKLFVYRLQPPTSVVLSATATDYGVPSKIYRDPYYSIVEDAPQHPREYAGLVYHLKGGEGLDTLQHWNMEKNDQHGVSPPALSSMTVGGWEFASSPPSIGQVKRWLLTDEGKRPTKFLTRPTQSQIRGPTQVNPFGLKMASVGATNDPQRGGTNMTLLSLEVLALTKGTRVPDPEKDEAVAVFYSFQGPHDVSSEANRALSYERRVFVAKSPDVDPRRLRDFRMEVFGGELELINAIIDRVNELDPDIVTGWEVQSSSWGYLAARGRTYGLDVEELISRAPGRQNLAGSEQWDTEQASTFKLIGRHVLNCWRIMRATQTLNIYTFENVVFNVLRRRVPKYNLETLVGWYNSHVPAETSRVLRYFLDRTSISLELLDEAEVITQTAEFARVFGVDFMSVLTRGSQFKVESFMFRIAKPESFLLISPSKQDVGKQNAAECMPLIMEPLSAFYSSPLVVLDFQSLYPSVMIAYNYCYSTCLGRVHDFKGTNKFGVSELHNPTGLLETLKEHLFVAPNGIIYVKPEVRKGLLGRMLTELLDTRIMVKQAMKKEKDNKALSRILSARQLSLKYICNVTYGYTSASYSGRMPAVEIADSIVQSGRETLEKAIRVIESTPKWGGKVVYGDTDSLFIYLRGKTKDQAFRIGHDIADTITTLNPAPIKLKFEKVYLPCVLIAKKRYVGFMYESPDDKEPGFDAKGIETVRRDGVPAQSKMTEACLKILFRTQDLSKVKEYCCRSWTKLLEGKASVQDFTFAKEIRMGTYSDKVPPPPGAAVAARRIMEDPNDEPQYGERVPYVIIRGEPNSRLVDRAVPPEEVVFDRHKRLDAVYYITRVLIPPLDRIFCLVGADVRSWYDEMPKSLRADTLEVALTRTDGADIESDRITIDGHFRSHQCLICGDPTPSGLCDACREQKATTIALLQGRRRKAEQRMSEAHQVCVSCSECGPSETIECVSLDCAWLYRRHRSKTALVEMYTVGELVAALDGD